MADSEKRAAVLLVDDVPSNIRTLADFLRDSYDIYVATRADEGLSLARRLRPDIILLDVVMPDMDGYEVCRRLMADPTTSDIPIIFVTARFAPEDEALGLSLGAVDYIVKPASRAVVRARVKCHLELRAAREALARQNEELKDAAQLREDVDCIMRHDLKAPLSGIIGLPPLILEQGGLTETQASFVRLIEESGLTMLSMINLSLDLFKMERGAYVLQSESVDMANMVRGLFAELGSLADRKGNTFLLMQDGKTMAAAARVLVSGERLLLYSMLANCLKNALEASPRETVVTVDLCPGNPVRVRIGNTGVVPRDIRDRFFEKYVTSGKLGGTGLGTYSTRLIVEAHGGSVWMDTSDVTDETWVTLSLPQAPA